MSNCSVEALSRRPRRARPAPGRLMDHLHHVEPDLCCFLPWVRTHLARTHLCMIVTCGHD
ncbi:hypothetical protein SAMN05421541_106395 [Actinoplanes philippinensis]|uniref:Uncharacterized protein n=2 Tax=Actinoplanes philippinensis TaxID=35752 RepID=A0A1I2GDG6_9ACTN|nr:hypothetical protein SAMN05421541_106395 [Actinoplanes philippinensis]